MLPSVADDDTVGTQIVLYTLVVWALSLVFVPVADMGLLLIVIMAINMVLSLVVLPLLVWFVKPRFVQRRDLLVGEGVDPALFTVAQ